MQKSKNHSIETLRAAAVLMVFANHLHSMGILTIPYFGISGGWLGVQIFFVISGYLIIQSAMRYSVRDYVRHRVFRIYPAYLFWFFFFSILTGSLTLASLDIKSLLTHLLFLQHFFPSASAKYNALPVSWTLTIEAVWYVLALLIASRFHKAPAKYTIFFILLACAWVTGGIHFGIFPGLQDPGQRYFYIQNSAIAQMPFFLFGAWIAVVSPRFDKAALLALIIPTVALFKSWEPIAFTPIFITGIGVAALFLLLKDLDYNNPKPVKIMADISYSFYLIHYPILILMSKYTENKYSHALLSFVVTSVVSYMSYVLIERPLIKMSRKKTSTATG